MGLKMRSANRMRSAECGVRNNIGLIGLISLIGLINPSNAQVVVGPLTSTPNAIPFFVDATGRKITNSTIIFTNNTLVINGITQVQNPFTTNNPAKAPNLLATSTSPIYPLMILIPDGSGSDRTIAYSPNFFMSNGVAFFLGNVHLSGLSSNTLLRIDAGGNINNIIGNTANTITYWTGSGTIAGLANGAEGTVLGISNGIPAYIAAGSDATNPVQNFYSTSNYFTVGKGGKLTITNNIIILTNGIVTLSNLPSPSVLVLNTDQAVTNAILSGITLSGNTLTASGGTAVYVNGTSISNPNMKDSGSITYTTTATTNITPTLAAQSFTALTYSGGTNITLDCSLGNNSEAFYTLTVTNTTFFAAPMSVPSTAKSFVVQFLMNGTGGYAITFTNIYKFPGGVVPIPTTNANAVTQITFTSSGSTAGQLYGDLPILDIK